VTLSYILETIKIEPINELEVIDMGLGQKIKKLREERAWTQERLAQIAEVSLKTIQRVEAGQNPSKETQMALASAFDIDLKDLINNDDDKKDETNKNDKPVFLTRISSSKSVLKIIEGAYGISHDHDELKNDEWELVSEFFQLISDYMDIWEILEIGDKIKVEKDIQELISRLEENNLWIFGTQDKQTINQANDSFEWDIAIFKIIRSSNPVIISSKVNEMVFNTL
jgi:transcriptional regulator with XRE-family HTH domain